MRRPGPRARACLRARPLPAGRIGRAAGSDGATSPNASCNPMQMMGQKGGMMGPGGKGPMGMKGGPQMMGMMPGMGGPGGMSPQMVMGMMGGKGPMGGMPGPMGMMRPMMPMMQGARPMGPGGAQPPQSQQPQQQPGAAPGGSLTAAALAAAPRGVQKQMLGENCDVPEPTTASKSTVIRKYLTL